MQVVDLFERGGGKLFDQRRSIGSARNQLHARKPATNLAKGLEVNLNNLFDAWSKHFDDDVFVSQIGSEPGRQFGPVCLS